MGQSLPDLAAILVRAIALGLCFCGSIFAQSSEEKPEKQFWPREVKISVEVKLEQKTRYGVVIAKRIAGSVVKVVSLDSDSLRIESDGFQGTISVAKTDFWDRAERTRNAAIERKKREQAAKEPERPATEPRPRPKTAEIHNPQILIGMTRERMLVLMGQPIELITSSHATDGGFKVYSYSKEKGKETYFVIWDNDGVIDNGMYQGVYFFKKR